jgi:hypothetical protein
VTRQFEAITAKNRSCCNSLQIFDLEKCYLEEPTPASSAAFITPRESGTPSHIFVVVCSGLWS